MKKGKKSWYVIQAPKIFNNVEIGETLALDPNSLIGKTASVNLMTLTRNMRNQNVKIRFRISKISDNKALTEVYSYELVPSFTRRLVRKMKSKIDDSFTLKTKDNHEVQVKIIALTKTIINKSVLTALRKQARKTLEDAISKLDYDAAISILISGRLQKQLRETLKKIYPLSSSEIRVFARK